MTKKRVSVIVGSLRKDSHNLKLAKAIGKLASDKLDFSIIDISELPLFSQDLEVPQLPTSVSLMKLEIENADAILFVTPEYNRSFSGVMKNAIDWASRPYGQNSFAKKPAAICGASVGAIGTACAQNALKPVLSYLDVKLMSQPEVYIHFQDGSIDMDGNISKPELADFLNQFTDQFIMWIDAA